MFVCEIDVGTLNVRICLPCGATRKSQRLQKAADQCADGVKRLICMYKPA